MPSADQIRFLVKVCGATTSDDLRMSIDAGANAIGFNFYPKSPRFLSIARARELALEVPENVLRVGVFVYPRESDLAEALQTTPLDVLQIYGTNPLTNPMRHPGARIWQSLPVDQTLHGSFQPDGRIEAYLLDTPTKEFGGSGRTFDWKLAAAFRPRKIVAGGLDASNVALAIEAARPWGVDACSRLESSPGRKDAAKVKEFVAAAFMASRRAAEMEITI